MKLTCRKCGSLVPIADAVTQAPAPRVRCPGCGARYRLRPRKTPAPASSTAGPPKTRTPAWTPATATLPPPPPAAPPPAVSPQPSAPAAPPATPAGPPPATAAPPAADSTESPTRVAGLVRPATGSGSSTGGRRRALDTTVFAIGDLVANRYRVVRFLAEGGMGEVYEVEDLELRTHLALKTISAIAMTDQQAIERFKREIHLARMVTHPNVCRIFDIGQHLPAEGGSLLDPPVTFLTMELLQGETLAERLSRDGRLSTAEALPLVRQMCAALGAAHAKNVVHRDFKSENVFLVAAGDGPPRAVVTDFGVARGGAEDDRFAALVTGAGIVGTPAYMAPEQVEGGVVTPAADIYALGVVLYETLTGKRPFAGDSPLSVAVKRLKEQPVPPHVLVPDLEPRWERAVLRCLERSPEKRFAKVEQVAQAVAPAARPRVRPAAAAPSPAVRPMAVPAAAAGTARRRGRLALLLVLLVLAGITAFLAFRVRDRATPRRTVPRQAVAVLGFKNVTGRAESAWLSTALAEMLSTELARGERLRTVPGETVARIRQELELPDTDSLSAESLGRVHALVGCDYVVLGSYLAMTGEGSEQIRLDLRLQDAVLGKTLAAVAETGAANDLFALVARAGEQLRDRLGTEVEADGGAASSGLPLDREAARLYAQALESLRLSAPLEARDRLQRALAREGDNPLLHAALSTAWEALGYSTNARHEAKRAYDLSSGLRREERLMVEGRYHEMGRDWPAAIKTYGSLWQQYPDNLEYGLRLTAVQTADRRVEAALRTIQEMRYLPAPVSEDPRIDLAEALAHGLTANFEAQLSAATHAAERAAALGAKLLHAQALIQRSQTHRVLGQNPEAESAARRALALYSEIENPVGAALALTSLANARFEQGALEEAEGHFREALDRYRAIGSPGGMAVTLNAQAMVTKQRGDLAGAVALYQEAAGLYAESGNEPGRANTLNNLAAVRYARDELTDAHAMFEASRAIWQQLGNRVGVAYALHNMAVVMRQLGELEVSRQGHEEALAIRREVGHRAGEAASLHGLGGVLTDLGRLDQAGEVLAEAVALAESIGNRPALAHALFNRGEVELAQGRLDDAFQSHQRSLTLRRELQEALTELDSRLALVRLALVRGEWAAAAVDAASVAEACAGRQRHADQARAVAAEAWALAEVGELAEARQRLDRAETLIAGSERLRARLEVALDGARVRARAGDGAAARADLADLEARAAAAGLLGLRLEAMLEQAAIDRRRDPAAARDRLIAVQSEAAIHGFGRLTERADTLIKSLSDGSR